MGGETVSAAYDAIAPEYDRQLEDDAWMRRFLWKRYGDAFRPGQHVLDVGCGTGTDAVFLGRRGIRVTAIDFSPAMIAQAEQKIAHHGLTDTVRVATLEIGDLACLPSTGFDGIISSFAALNTLPSLTQFAADAARLLQPHGKLMLHLLNGSSLWELACLLAHRRWLEARQLSRRRERSFKVGGRPIHHYVPRADELYASCFAPHFRLCRACGLGITRPPHRIGSVPEALHVGLGRLDELLGSHHPFIDWGRFVMLEMVSLSDTRPPEAERARRSGRRRA
jgi:SAM-dependent methyltransferase